MATVINSQPITEIDLSHTSVRQLNAALHGATTSCWRVAHPDGRHNIAVGLDADLHVTVDGHVGYYCAGMNKTASVTVLGNAGPGVGENMMSGTVRIKGAASQSAGASAHGGLLVIEGSAAARCGISMKGADIIVGGDVGHMSAFMAQAGRLIVCGDAGEAFGDSIYETRIYLRGRARSLGADCIEKPMRPEHLVELADLLLAAGIDADARQFRRLGSARGLYNFHPDNASSY